MLTGLCALPLTPLVDDTVDVEAFTRIVETLAASEVDSIAVLSSTGSCASLDGFERARVVVAAAAAAGDTPLVAGIGALRTSHVIAYAQDAADCGAEAVLLAPMSHQALTDDDVYGLCSDVLEHLTVPLIVCDDPGTMHGTSTDDLLARIASLPGVASIVMPGVAPGLTATQRLTRLRGMIPESVTIGVCGDAVAATALAAGADAWCSPLAGALPEPALRIIRAVRRGDARQADTESRRLQAIWGLFAEHGSDRVVAAIAAELGMASSDCLPLPMRGLDDAQRARVRHALHGLGVLG